MPATSQPLASSDIQRPQADFAPTPPSVDPMAAFPENATLEQTVDFVVDQVLAGHPEAVWVALPQELRTELDSQAVRDAMRPSMDDQKALAAPIKRTVMMVCELAVKQKQYITNTPMLGAIPPQAKDMMLEVYDPAVGTIYELVNGLFDSELMIDNSISAWVSYYGPRIGGHLQGLIDKAPPGMIDGFRQSIQVKSTGPTTGVVTIPPPPGAGPNATPKDVEMVQVQGRWLPADLAKMWQENQGGLAASFKQQYEASKAQMAQQQQQASLMIMMVTGTVEGGLRSLLNATSQEQFDAELNKAMTMAQQLGAQFGGMGGPPGGGPPAGAPPAGF